jgi:hypothetical protein
MEEEEMLKKIVVAAAVGSLLFLSVCNPPVSAKAPIPITSFRLVANDIPGWAEDLTTTYYSGDTGKLYGPMDGFATPYIAGGTVEFSIQYLKKDSTGKMDYCVIDFGTTAKAQTFFTNYKAKNSITVSFGTHTIDECGLSSTIASNPKIVGYYQNYYYELNPGKYETSVEAKSACELFIAMTKKKIDQ